MSSPNATVARLRLLTQRPRWSQQRLAEMFGVSQTTISKWLAGEHVASPYQMERLTQLENLEVTCLRCDTPRPAFGDGIGGPKTHPTRYCGVCADPTVPLYCGACARILSEDWVQDGQRCCTGCGALLEPLIPERRVECFPS